MSRCVTKRQVIAALGLDGGTLEAAVRLGVSRKTVHRAMVAYALVARRHRVVPSDGRWSRLHAENGGSVRRVARTLAMSRSYIKRRLEELGIRPVRDEWAQRQEAGE
jgi:transcriptional regulator of acetoin/glycerol metabolism